MSQIVVDVQDFRDGPAGRTPIDAATLNRLLSSMRQMASAVNAAGGLVPSDLQTVFFDDFNVAAGEIGDAVPAIGDGYSATLAGRYEVNGTSKLLQVRADATPAPDIAYPVYARSRPTTGTDMSLSFIVRLRTNSTAPVQSRMGMGVKVNQPDGIFMDVTGFSAGHTARIYIIVGGVQTLVSVFDSSVLEANKVDQNVFATMSLTGSTLTATLNNGTVTATLTPTQVRALEGYNATSFVSTDDRFRLDNWTAAGRVPISTGISNDQLAEMLSQPGPARSALIELISSQLTISTPGTVTQRADGRPVFNPEGV
jgi:hypothetical protein